MPYLLLIYFLKYEIDPEVKNTSLQTATVRKKKAFSQTDSGESIPMIVPCVWNVPAVD